MPHRMGPGHAGVDTELAGLFGPLKGVIGGLGLFKRVFTLTLKYTLIFLCFFFEHFGSNFVVSYGLISKMLV